MFIRDRTANCVAVLLSTSTTCSDVFANVVGDGRLATLHGLIWYLDPFNTNIYEMNANSNSVILNGRQ
jgi:hypothetical protein